MTLRTLGCLVSDGKPWLLCVGAGCSLPAFPSWEELAISLARQVDTIPNDLANMISRSMTSECSRVITSFMECHNTATLAVVKLSNDEQHPDYSTARLSIQLPFVVKL